MKKELSEYRPVTDSEIQLLLSKNCSSDDWTSVEIKPGTDLHKCKNSHFSGYIKLGLFDNTFTDESGVEIHSGIVNSHIHNCIVGDNVSVYNVRDYIANYIIEENTVIRNCGRIHVEGFSSFGNGTDVAVLNETGTRAVKIWDRLSSQQAYIMALYRHRPKAMKRLEEMISEYSLSVTSGTGTIGKGSHISNCTSIRNVKIGPFSKLDGAVRLTEGSVNSCMEDPVRIGHGVIMEHFIVCSGSVIDNSTLVDKCFIGQGCNLGKNYSAENSLFFANSGGYHGEACSLFAGPYTVTHHKSTLLIAGLFSFMNAGSGSNQSNHMYKLGPVHQGIIERGSKTTSDSYIQWPAHIGPFTLIKGRHYNNIDSSLFPFSYIIENKDESILVPGINLRSIGTIRDAQKWPERDVRKDPIKIDKIDFEILNPNTVHKMMAGRDILKKMRSENPGNEFYNYYGMRINKSSLDRGIDLYQAGISKYLGNALIKRLGQTHLPDITSLRARLIFDRTHGSGEWVDLSGMIVPGKEVDILLDRIETASLKSLDELSDYISKIHDGCREMEWTWAASTLEKEENLILADSKSEDIIRIIKRWRKGVTDLDNLLIEDAKKEFSYSSMTGFGVDGNDEDKQLDFEQVRGTFETNKFIRSILSHLKTKSEIGDELTERIKRIK